MKLLNACQKIRDNKTGLYKRINHISCKHKIKKALMIFSAFLYAH
jgi:hypothetical protein